MTAAVDIRQDDGILLTRMGMLTNEDLQAIGTIVDTKLDEKLEPVLEAVRDGFEAVDRRFDEFGKELRAEWRKDLAETRHELMDHTDRTVQGLRVELKADIGGLRAELRERDLIG